METRKVKLSRVSKLDGIRSWSLAALDTCPGAKMENGELVPACEGCYARRGNYRFKTAKAVRDYNWEDWRSGDWVDRMVAELDNDRYFRWFDSGDIFTPELAKKIFEICKRTPWVKHWLPTRSYKVARIKVVLEEINQLSNVVVRYSSDSIHGEFLSMHGSTIVPDVDSVPDGVSLCGAYKTGRCDGCRACWNKSIKVIGYVAHGKAMEGLLRKSRAAG